LTIEKILEDKNLTNIVAFHVQQCIEKSFKAIICIKTKVIPKIHNLIKLYGTVKNHIKLSFDMKIFEQINESYTETRYPSGLGLLSDGIPSSGKALLFYHTAKNIFNQIKNEVEYDTQNPAHKH